MRTLARFREDFKGKSLKAFRESVYTIPYKTGKLRRNVKYNEVGKNSRISVDLEKVPYAEYINRPGYRTHGWWDKLCNVYRFKLKRYSK